ncbi:MAG: phosphate ABC transporter permease subunit PstC [Acidobacteria bacterium]|nr:phosphate ABC transporter permease subunit PstC [Acidobacteriota bacterium]
MARWSRSRHRWSDVLFRRLTACFALSILILLVWMLITLALNARQALARFGWGFLWGRTWDPVREQFGALPFVYGTIVSSTLALCIAVPLSLGVAIFLSEHAPRGWENVVAFLVDTLAAIPSVIYGLWGIFILSPALRNYIEPWLASTFGFLPLFQGPPYGIGMLAGGIILAIMVLPIITAVSRDVLQAVPNTQREAALSLGATRWETTRVVLAHARAGLTGAVILGLGRAIGETMAVTMVIGNRPEISYSLFDPSYTIASVIANEFNEATYELYVQALIELGLILFLVTLIVNAVARLLVWSVTRRTREVQRV